MRLSLSECPKLTLPAVCVPQAGDGTREEAIVPNFARIPLTSQGLCTLLLLRTRGRLAHIGMLKEFTLKRGHVVFSRPNIIRVW